jgi:hypothetical protein
LSNKFRTEDIQFGANTEYELGVDLTGIRQTLAPWRNHLSPVIVRHRTPIIATSTSHQQISKRKNRDTSKESRLPQPKSVSDMVRLHHPCHRGLSANALAPLVDVQLQRGSPLGGILNQIILNQMAAIGRSQRLRVSPELLYRPICARGVQQQAVMPP